MAAALTNGMLRPALELAWAVAKLGSAARPAVAPPGRLRPLMRFAKLPDRALLTVRQVVDEDDAFRARVAEVADKDGLGPAPWLWLVRPEGWEEDLGALAEAAGAAALEVQEEREERRARRKLSVVEAAAARAESELDRLRQVNAELQREVAAERQGRRRAEVERDDATAGFRATGDQRERAVQTAAAVEARMSSLANQLDEATGRLAATRDELDIAQAEAERLRGELRAADRHAVRLTETAEQTRAAAALAVSRATAAARQLSDALAEVTRAVGGNEGDDDEPRPDAPVAVVSQRSVRRARGGRPSPPPASIRRRPMALPPAVFDDSIEAADHLVRAPGMLLVVDGYNVTISSWPHLELPRQRHRLVDALAELAMRAGPMVHVVFDGDDSGGRFEPPAAARRHMRVTFSPEGVDADEVIVDLVDHLDPSQPVVVATDDRRVRQEVERRGANVISVAQLLAVIGRAPGVAAVLR